MNERHTIEELEILYPDRYIIITDLDKDEHNVISGGIVRHIGDEDSHVDVMVDYNERGIKFAVISTYKSDGIVRLFI